MSDIRAIPTLPHFVAGGFHGFVILAWMGSGIYLFWTTDGASFFSWQAALFFLFGWCPAVLVIHPVASVCQIGAAKSFVRVFGPDAENGRVGIVLYGLWFVIFVVEVVAAVYLARWSPQLLI